MALPRKERGTGFIGQNIETISTDGSRVWISRWNSAAFVLEPPVVEVQCDDNNNKNSRSRANGSSHPTATLTTRQTCFQ
ncbi:hypothetical protein K0M31_014383 [Melipona bicolor]|uniref:Uncharacterized protein n=1 Tax=Melipona bicolor TaxID=60889 RepID=A0AA40KUA8_9HYME|nr:hypothetical protein K0M31_014383 [Melipona bicolor]